MLYHNPNNISNTNADPIRGVSLARRQLTPIQRAFIAADIYAGALVVNDLTIAQSAAIAGSNVGYVRCALRADPADRAAIEAGAKPFIIPSSHALERTIRAAGVERTWQIIEKLLG